MPNLARIYTDSISVKQELEREEAMAFSPAEDAARVQSNINWLNSTRTQEIFKEIYNKIESLEKQAHDLAWNYAQHQNPLQIVKLLNEATTLRKIIEEYGRSH